MALSPRLPSMAATETTVPLRTRATMALEDRLHASLGIYMRAPGWVRGIGGRLWRAVPDRLRHGARHVDFVRDARRAGAGIGWDEIAQRLDATLQAASHVPAYALHAERLRDRRIDPLQRLRELPLLDKSALKADLQRYVRTGSSPDDRLQTFTGGSTAQPMLFYLQRHVTRPKESAWLARIEAELMGVRRADWALSLRGRTVASAARHGGALWTTEPVKRHLLFSSDHLEADFMPAYVQALRRLRPRHIHAFPSALHPLARWLREHPAPDYTEQVASVLLTSENLYDFQHALLAEVFPNARIVRHYGHSERVLLALGTSGSAQVAFEPLYGLPELVDAQGRVIDVPGIAGEIVGTSFDNHVMPFLRYRTGDIGTWAEAPDYSGNCAGRRRFVMQRIEGRSQEFVVCADRRLVSITTLGAAHFDALAAVDSIQFEQREPGVVQLKVVKAGGLADGERTRIATAVREKTQGGCRVEVLVVPQIERTARGKHRMLVQHLSLDDHLGAAITPARQQRLLEEADALVPAR